MSYCGYDLAKGEGYEEKFDEGKTFTEGKKDSDWLSTTYKVLSYILIAIGFITSIVLGKTYPIMNREYKEVFNVSMMFTAWVATFLVWLGTYSIGVFFSYQHTVVRLLKRADDRAIFQKSALSTQKKDVTLKTDEAEEHSTAGTV